MPNTNKTFDPALPSAIAALSCLALGLRAVDFAARARAWDLAALMFKALSRLPGSPGAQARMAKKEAGNKDFQALQGKPSGETRKAREHQRRKVKDQPRLPQLTTRNSKATPKQVGDAPEEERPEHGQPAGPRNPDEAALATKIPDKAIEIKEENPGIAVVPARQTGTGKTPIADEKERSWIEAEEPRIADEAQEAAQNGFNGHGNWISKAADDPAKPESRDAVAQALARLATTIEAHSKTLASLDQRHEALERKVHADAETASRQAQELTKNQRS